MIDLERRLTEIGGLLDLPSERSGGTDLTPEIVDRVTVPPTAGRVAWAWRVAVVVLVVLAAAAAAPTTRDAVSGWLGLDRVTIERRDDGSPPPTSVDPPTEPGFDGEPVVVDGRTVLVAAIDGRLSDVVITKTLASDAPVRMLDIDGAPALWVESAHDVLIEVDGAPVAERVAGSTLLWQDGDVLRRVEGFETLDDAVEFARSR